MEGTATRVVDGVPPLLVSGAFPVNALLFVDSLKALPTGKLILLRGDSGSYRSLVAPGSSPRVVDRRLALIVTLAFLALPLAAEAQPAGAVRTIGVLGTSKDGYPALKERLRELGWVEGNTVRFAGCPSADYRELPRLAAELVRVQ